MLGQDIHDRIIRVQRSVGGRESSIYYPRAIIRVVLRIVQVFSGGYHPLFAHLPTPTTHAYHALAQRPQARPGGRSRSRAGEHYGLTGAVISA